MHHRFSRPGASGFTLVEVLVAVAVLALLVALLGQLFINVTAASSISSNHMESDARVRLLFERMAADFSHILKRTDIDCYLKAPSYSEWTSPAVTAANNLQTGPANDQMAFFSEVAGYSDVTGIEQNSVSLVAYRVNTTGTAPCIERLGKALSWSGGASGIFPVAFMPSTILTTWPAATLTPASSGTSDPAYDADFETIVPSAFRFEYYYQLRSGALSATPWYDSVRPAPDGSIHTTLNGFADVAGIGVVVAVTDHKSTQLIAASALQTLTGQLVDAPSNGTILVNGSTVNFTVGTMQQNWQATVSGSALPAAAKNGIRVYEQLFSISAPAQ